MEEMQPEEPTGARPEAPPEVATPEATSEVSPEAPPETTSTNGEYSDQELLECAQELKRLFDELGELYPERTHLMNQLLFALLTREHVLVHGMYGTAKTALANAVFQSFDSQVTFAVQLTKFMTEANVIGVPDPRIMREEGVIFYRPEGQILEANFAELDEFFDANSPLLRTMLGVLNEREFKRGRQYEKAKLHTAIASTNGEPDAVIKQSPELGAIIDRFIFRCKIEYLQSPASRLKMYKNFAAGKRPTVHIDYKKLESLSDLVLNRIPVDDDTLLRTYDQALTVYKQRMQGQVVSDRRACKLLNLMRASAVLNGRLQVILADIRAVRWGLCIGNDKNHHDTFDYYAKPIIDNAIAAASAQAQQ